MKILKRVLLGLAILLLLISAVGLLFFPARIEVSRSVTIQATPEAVFDYANEIRNFNDWSPWYRMDTAAKYVFEGPDSGKGASMKWESDSANVGKGSMVYTESIPYSVIKQDLNFMEGGIAKSEYRFSLSDSGTVMTWSFAVEAGANPLLRILGAFMDGMIGRDFEQGLSRLKKTLEAEPALQVRLVDFPELHFLSVRAKADERSISEVLGKSYARIMSVMQQQGLVFADAPFAIYHSPPPVFDMEIGIPVVDPGRKSGDVLPGSLGPCKAVMVRYFGAYEKTVEAHAAIDRHIKENGLTVIGSPWEMYVTDPATEKDTAKWETDIYYPVK